MHECQCCLFLFDITAKSSFKLINNLVEVINYQKFPYMKSILVQNKVDKKDIPHIEESEISEFFNADSTSLLKIGK